MPTPGVPSGLIVRLRVDLGLLVIVLLSITCVVRSRLPIERAR